MKPTDSRPLFPFGDGKTLQFDSEESAFICSIATADGSHLSIAKDRNGSFIDPNTAIAYWAWLMSAQRLPSEGQRRLNDAAVKLVDEGTSNAAVHLTNTLALLTAVRTWQTGGAS